jgi:TPR repeat protein
MPSSKSDLARLNKAKAAMKRADYAPHASRGLRDARKLLKPLVEKNIPEAQYLAASFALAHEFKSDADFNKWRYKLIHKAAESGYAPAQFALGQAYDQYGDLEHDAEKSAYWFSLSAEQGYVHGQWVHGWNLFGGRGLPKDEALGITFICKAAENKFEGALQLLRMPMKRVSSAFRKIHS